jgi:CRISPR-associated exonuclease Cas4
MDEEFQVNGTLIWYYYICKRQVWLMAHALNPDPDDENIQQGRNIHEYSYPRDKKELNLGPGGFGIFHSNKLYRQLCCQN